MAGVCCVRKWVWQSFNPCFSSSYVHASVQPSSQTPDLKTYELRLASYGPETCIVEGKLKVVRPEVGQVCAWVCWEVDVAKCNMFAFL